MVRRILGWILLVSVLAIVGWWGYRLYINRAHADDVASGEVVDSDGNSARPTPSRSDAPGTINTTPVKTTARDTSTQSASLAELQTIVRPTPMSGAAAPAADTQTPNAPNGVPVAGSGRFQVYRQGNLTWRVNTDNGHTCILFATDEEWQKPLVYSHGCGNS